MLPPLVSVVLNLIIYLKSIKMLTHKSISLQALIRLLNANILRKKLFKAKIIKTYELTNSMAYGTRRFNAAITRALQ